MKTFTPILALGVTILLCQGCVTIPSISRFHHDDKILVGQPYQVHATWENRVVTTADSVNHGKPLIGLAGRLYLFGAEIGYPLKSNGSILVDAHEVQPDGQLRMLERWEIDPITLQKLGRKDAIGWGYTLFLPWSSYKPDINRVQLQVKFIPEQGVPLFSPPATVTLRQSDGSPPVTTNSVVPAKAEKKAATP